MSKKLLGFVRALLKVPEEKGLTEEQIDEQLLRTGAYADICEAAREGKLTDLDRDKHRALLSLPPLNPPATEKIGDIECMDSEEFDLHTFFDTNNPIVKFRYIDPDLKKYFPERIVAAEGPRQLSTHRLIRTAKEKELLAVAKKTTWIDIKQLLEKQSHGESGDLLTNGYANLFFIGGCRVSVDWRAAGWRVDVDPVLEARVWIEGDQVFSRN